MVNIRLVGMGMRFVVMNMPVGVCIVFLPPIVRMVVMAVFMVVPMHVLHEPVPVGMAVPFRK